MDKFRIIKDLPVPTNYEEIQKLLKENNLFIARDYYNGIIKYRIVSQSNDGIVKVLGTLDEKTTKEDCIEFLNKYKKTVKLFPLKEKGYRKAEADEDGNVEFTIKCKMKERWVPYFLAMLKRMQWNGEAGHSAILAFYDDGDGDFRPKFKSDVDYVYPITKTNYDWKDEKTGELHKGMDIINSLTEIDELFDAG